MDRIVFRPLRGHSPAVMLVTTFAVAFILQSIALLAFGSYGKTASQFAFLNAPWYIGGVAIPKIAVIAIVTAAVCLGLLQLLLTRTPLGLHMRAASMDFRTAQLLGVRANRVIVGAVVISGAVCGDRGRHAERRRSSRSRARSACTTRSSCLQASSSAG